MKAEWFMWTTRTDTIMLWMDIGSTTLAANPSTMRTWCFHGETTFMDNWAIIPQHAEAAQ
jgi:hypothetical protein